MSSREQILSSQAAVVAWYSTVLVPAFARHCLCSVCEGWICRHSTQECISTRMRLAICSCQICLTYFRCSWNTLNRGCKMIAGVGLIRLLSFARYRRLHSAKAHNDSDLRVSRLVHSAMRCQCAKAIMPKHTHHMLINVSTHVLHVLTDNALTSSSTSSSQNGVLMWRRGLEASIAANHGWAQALISLASCWWQFLLNETVELMELPFSYLLQQQRGTWQGMQASSTCVHLLA
jgi:hypothetical protein